MFAHVFYPNEYAIVAVANNHFPVGTLVKIVGGSWNGDTKIETLFCVAVNRGNEKKPFSSWQLMPLSE